MGRLIGRCSDDSSEVEADLSMTLFGKGSVLGICPRIARKAA